MTYGNDDATVSLLGSLLQISLAINASLDLTDILTQVTNSTRKLVGCDRSSVVLWNPDKAQFEVGASTDADDAVSQQLCRDGGASRWILDHGRPFVVPATSQDPFSSSQLTMEPGILAYVGVPLRHADQPLGVLYALYNRPRRFDQGELPLMQALADIAAIAVRNAQLVQALQRMNEFKDTLMQMAAHDLRNPLSEAIGFLSLLVEALGDVGPENEDYVARIQRALHRVDRLIEAILMHERATTGQLERQPCDLNHIVELVAFEFEPIAAQKSQHLSLQQVATPLVVHGDSLLLQQAVGNLVSNAIRYTPTEGQITIQTQDSQDEFTVIVQDNGPGISPDDQHRLFHPFVRLKSAGRERGSGLGLSLVKTVVERHGGRISVESSPGQGTLFAIHLPAHRPAPNGSL
jgi:signal transduction histidine kinase